MKIKQDDPLKPVPTEVLATAIQAISTGVKRLLDGPLREGALVLLIQNAAPTLHPGYRKVTVNEVKAVLAGITSLEAVYLKKPVRK